MRRLARNNAILSKIQSEGVAIVDGLNFKEPKTARFAKMLGKLQADRSCVFATAGIDRNLWKSGRNIPKTAVIDVAEVNAWHVLTHSKVIFTRDAFAKFRDLAAGKKGA